MEWISIADKKPDDASPVLVYHYDDEVAVAQYINGEFIVPHCAQCDSGWSAYRICDVTHWARLPQRPMGHDCGVCKNNYRRGCKMLASLTLGVLQVAGSVNKSLSELCDNAFDWRPAEDVKKEYEYALKTAREQLKELEDKIFDEERIIASIFKETPERGNL